MKNRAIHKTAPVLMAKALDNTDQPGVFEAVWSVFGIVDAHGDVVAPGAFAESLEKALPPVVWSHQRGTPPIGVTLEADELDRAGLEKLGIDDLPKEVTGGVYSKARLFVNQDAGEDVPLARSVHAALFSSGGDGRSALREFSWGGRVLEETTVRDPNTGLVDHWRIDVASADEWGPCLRGANPATELLAVKSLIEHGVITRDQARAALELTDEQRTAGASKASLPSGGGDPQDRLRIAELLLP